MQDLRGWWPKASEECNPGGMGQNLCDTFHQPNIQILPQQVTLVVKNKKTKGSKSNKNKQK
jgi:hypothetical protein